MSYNKIGDPFVDEWYTFTHDENGNIPPKDEWVLHKRELITVEYDKFKSLQQKIQAQDKLIEELEAALIHYAFGEKIYRIDNTVERGTARKALAKIKEYKQKYKPNEE